MAAAVAPLRTLHCLLVLDGVSRPLLTAEPLKAALEALLNFARVRTLLTAPTPVAQPLQGGSEKVIALEPLSAHNTARLLCRLSPRTLLLSEIAGATSASNFVQKLSLHPLVEKMHGNRRRQGDGAAPPGAQGRRAAGAARERAHERRARLSLRVT